MADNRVKECPVASNIKPAEYGEIARKSSLSEDRVGKIISGDTPTEKELKEIHTALGPGATTVPQSHPHK